MTLIELGDLLQGSDEWLEQRRGIVTASVVGKLLTTTGRVASNVSDDMLRGQEDEPRAVEVYSEHFAPVTTTGFMIRREDTWTLGYSPDGLVGDDGLIEVKSRRQKKQLTTVLSGEVPPENMAQLQAGLLVSGRQWIDYVSYCGGMPLWVKRVEPDQRWFDAIVTAAIQFEESAAEMVAAYYTATAGMPATERVIEMEMVI
jgi:hypothetical protein